MYKEYYCYDCGELRLFAFPNKDPIHCGNCKSTKIEVGEIGTKKLTKLRKGH